MHPITRLAVPVGRLAIHWFEQSAYALKDASGVLVVIDPYFPTDRPSERFVHPQPPATGADLPADIVLLTHLHRDHTDPESISQIRSANPGALYVGPGDALAKIIAESQIEPGQTLAVDAGQSVQIKGVTVHVVYAKPPGGDPVANIPPPDVPHLGYVVEMAGHRLYFSGDPIHTFPDLAALVRPVAALQPQIGFLTTHPSEGEFPFFAGSVQMAQRIGLAVAVPAHYQCFVKRNYDPQVWAAHFPPGLPHPLIIKHNSSIIWGEL